MNALLLAAGRGTRLQPLTDYIPKCLVPIHGVPLIQYWLEAIQGTVINNVYVNKHYLSGMVGEYLDSVSPDYILKHFYEPKLLGTGGTLKTLAKNIGSASCLIAHADNLTKFDLDQFIEAHKNRPKNCLITMMLFETDQPKLCGIVKRDVSGVVSEFYEKVQNPPGNLANAAVYIFEPEVIRFVREIQAEVIDISTQVLPFFLGKINTFVNDRYHRDIGNMQSYIAANHEFTYKEDFIIFNKKTRLCWNKIINDVWPKLKIDKGIENIFSLNKENFLASNENTGKYAEGKSEMVYLTRWS